VGSGDRVAGSLRLRNCGGRCARLVDRGAVPARSASVRWRGEEGRSAWSGRESWGFVFGAVSECGRGADRFVPGRPVGASPWRGDAGGIRVPAPETASPTGAQRGVPDSGGNAWGRWGSSCRWGGFPGCGGRSPPPGRAGPDLRARRGAEAIGRGDARQRAHRGRADGAGMAPAQLPADAAEDLAQRCSATQHRPPSERDRRTGDQPPQDASHAE